MFLQLLLWWLNFFCSSFHYCKVPPMDQLFPLVTCLDYAMQSFWWASSSPIHASPLLLWTYMLPMYVHAYPIGVMYIAYNWESTLHVSLFGKSCSDSSTIQPLCCTCSHKQQMHGSGSKTILFEMLKLYIVWMSTYSRLTPLWFTQN